MRKGWWRSFVFEKGGLEVVDPIRYDFVAEWGMELREEKKLVSELERELQLKSDELSQTLARINSLDGALKTAATEIEVYKQDKVQQEADAATAVSADTKPTVPDDLPEGNLADLDFADGAESLSLSNLPITYASQTMRPI